MLIQFGDRIYLQLKTQWFIWEPAWELYRPIAGLVWNGEKHEIDDTEYCKDPTTELYGFGSEKMKELCEVLTEKFPRENAVRTTSFPIGNATWFRDRMASVTICTPKDIGSWKKMISNSKARTCKNLTRNRFTRRKLVLS